MTSTINEYFSSITECVLRDEGFTQYSNITINKYFSITECALCDEGFTQYSNITINEYIPLQNVYYVMKASLSILHNIARNSGMKHLFDENKTSEVIHIIHLLNIF